MRGITLGIHLIMKNEEAVLSSCLKSVAMIADEIIAVDTGSSDRSVEIAASFGAHVLRKPWVDDFSEIRNTALQEAGTDWILWIDADERAVAGVEQVKQEVARCTADAKLVKMESLYGEHPEERIIFYAARLFRNQAGLRFRGRIHEQLLIPGESVSTAVKYPVSALELKHSGYLPSIIEGKKKRERNVRILQRCLSDNSGNAFHLYNIGVTCCGLRRLEEANQYFEHCYQQAQPQAPYRASLIRDWARLLMVMKQELHAIELIHREIERYSDYADLYYIQGLCFQQLGFHADACAAYEMAIRTGSASEQYVCEYGAGTFRPLVQMAGMLDEGEDFLSAARLYRQALQTAPFYELAQRGYMDALTALGRSEREIIEEVNKLLCGISNEPEQKAELLLYAGLAEKADQVLDTANGFEHTKGNKAIKLLRIEAKLQRGHLEEAVCEMISVWAYLNAAERENGFCKLVNIRWSQGTSLSDEEWRLCEHNASDYRSLEASALGKKDGFVQNGLKAVHALAEKVIQTAVRYRMNRLAEKLSYMDEHLLQVYAKALYQQGLIYPASNVLLDLMKSHPEALDAEAHFILAEMIYQKGHYPAAACFFNQSAEGHSLNNRARIGAAVSCLQQAMKTLQPGEAHGVEHSLTAEVQKQVNLADQEIKRLNATGWRTVWKGVQRRNRYGPKADITLHDRQR